MLFYTKIQHILSQEYALWIQLSTLATRTIITALYGFISLIGTTSTIFCIILMVISTEFSYG
jgi:hypothetical protein